MIYQTAPVRPSKQSKTNGVLIEISVVTLCTLALRKQEHVLGSSLGRACQC